MQRASEVSASRNSSRPLVGGDEVHDHSPMFEFERIDHVAISALDVDRSVQWYLEVLGFERRHEALWNGVPAFVGKGDVAIAIFPASQQPPAAGAERKGPRLLHFALRTDRRNFATARRDLTSHGVAFEFQDHEIAHSIYFRDPDDHEIEITTYEL